jgi:predicted membrane protein
MDTPSVYSSIVSPRSRRLRTIGILLLVAVCGMVIFGYYNLMPSLARSIRENPLPAYTSIGARRSDTPDPAMRPMTRAERLRKLRVAVALAYWGVCGMLIVGVVFVAWMDLREISRTYVEQRRAMWTQAADRLESRDDTS